jgi:hypothetical protein
MRLRRWALAAAVLGGLLSFLYLAIGQFFVAAVILGFTVFLVALRIRFDASPDARPGAHALRHFRVETAQVIGLLIALVATFVAALIGALHHWQKDARGSVALFALYGMEILLMMEMQRRSDSALNWLVGSRAEQHVGAQLELLREKGWLVIHRLVKDFGGDVDHLVCGPHGAYAIETKSGHFAWRHAGQAQASAKFAMAKLGLSGVVPVVCVGHEFRPTLKGSVWVMSSNHLVPWLLSRRDDAVDVNRAATRLELPVSE